VNPFLSVDQKDDDSPLMIQEDNDSIGQFNEILVFKSRPSLIKKLNTTIRSVDDDGEIYEELARRRMLASRTNTVPDDKISILHEAKMELSPSDIRKDDRLV
jgi:hypothetical protein